MVTIHYSKIFVLGRTTPLSWDIIPIYHGLKTAVAFIKWLPSIAIATCRSSLIPAVNPTSCVISQSIKCICH